MEKGNQERKNVFKTWLETLQQESWQLELLISGLALFGVFEAKGLLDSLEAFFSIQFLRGSAILVVNTFIFLLKGSWYIFLINLLIHIVLRGLWIGAIGLRYVSQDINYEELRFSSYFKNLYTKRYESFDDYIEDLEKLCSVIFAYTFLLFFILISACLFVIWPAFFMYIFGDQVGVFITMFYVLIGFFVFIDFILLNPFKRVEDKLFGKIYGFVFRFYSTITLSFIFRPLLLNFLDNKFTKKLFLFSIPYGIVIILILPKLSGETISYFPNFDNQRLSHQAYSQYAVNPNFYDDLRSADNQTIEHLSLKSFHVDGAVLEFFIVHLKKDENYFSAELNIPRINKVGINSIFRNSKAIDTTLTMLSDSLTTEVVDFLKDKKENISIKSEQEWDNEFALLKDEHDRILRTYHANRILEINNAFTSLNKYYIDHQDVSEEVSCLLTTHKNLGEKGWSCFVNLDSLSNGLHSFKLERGMYDRNNKTINKMVLEIPFILDKK